MRRLFLSDLHLQSVDQDSFKRFTECLASEAQFNDEIYVLGDLTEMWIGDDDDSDLATSLLTSFRNVADQCRIFLMHGNRDFLFGEGFCSAAGITLLPDPYRTEDGLLLSHGDAYCTDDDQYQAMRKLFRSAEWQEETLAKTLAERKALGEMIRAQSKLENANKASNIMDVNRGVIDDLLAAHRSSTLIHGHTHRPGKHRHGPNVRMVLGAWERVGWVIRQLEGIFQLECFSLARRYGT